MMSGLAQVIAIKPIFKSFFSFEPLSSANACKALKGKTELIAALAVFAPTALKKPRRTESTGNSAFTKAASIKSLEVCSTLCTGVNNDVSVVL